LRADISAGNSQDFALLSTLKIIAPPTFLFFGKDGNELSSLRLVGEISTGEFLQKLEAALQQK